MKIILFYLLFIFATSCIKEKETIDSQISEFVQLKITDSISPIADSRYQCSGQYCSINFIGKNIKTGN